MFSSSEVQQRVLTHLRSRLSLDSSSMLQNLVQNVTQLLNSARREENRVALRAVALADLQVYTIFVPISRRFSEIYNKVRVR